MSEELSLVPESDFALEINLPAEVQGVVNEFTTELADLTEHNDAQPLVYDYESFVNTYFGGREGAEALAILLNSEDINSTLVNVLSRDQMESFAWHVLDNTSVQDIVLADPAIREAISQRLFDGLSIDYIQENILPQDYEADSFDRQQKREAEIIEGNERVLDFQETFFVEGVDDTIKSLGINTSNIERVQDALMLAQAKFLKANHAAYLQLQSTIEKYGRSEATLLAESRLHNQWHAFLLKELQKLSSQKFKAAPVRSEPKETNSSKSYDLGSNDWLNDFVQDFKAERLRRGL